MGRITRAFEQGKALIAFIMAGDPSLKKTEELVLALEDGGADIVELGVPFSEPIADGPVIQRAGQRALKAGTTLAKIMDLVSALRERTQIPLVLMGYYNPFFRYGLERCVRDAVAVGVDGFIVPDLTPEESGPLLISARKHGLDTIFLLAPTSTLKRIALVSRVSTGFLYYVSLTGVTGMRTRLSATIAPMVNKIKRYTDLPLAVGFGVSSPKHVRGVLSVADGVVVGSAIVSLIENGGPGLLKRVQTFVRNLKNPL